MNFLALRLRLRRCASGFVLVLLCLAGLPVTATDVLVETPGDKTVVRGTMQVRIRPVDAPGERYFADPDVTLINETGRTVASTIAVRDPKTKVCELSLNTERYPDGVYLLTVAYRNLAGNRARSVRTELSLSFRNRGPKPARFVVEAAPAVKAGDDGGTPITVRVFDAKGTLLPGARVEFQATGGELDTPAELTHHDGEAIATVQSPKAGMCSVTIRVEALPPITHMVRFLP